jgi:hypothetical protein
MSRENTSNELYAGVAAMLGTDGLILRRRVPLESTRRTQAVRESGDAVDEARRADVWLPDGVDIVPRDNAPIRSILYYTFMLHVDAEEGPESASAHDDRADGARGGNRDGGGGDSDGGADGDGEGGGGGDGGWRGGGDGDGGGGGGGARAGNGDDRGRSEGNGSTPPSLLQIAANTVVQQCA